MNQSETIDIILYCGYSSTKMKYTLEEAKEYSKKGKAKNWIISLLKDTDNNGFSNYLKNHEGTIEGPIKIALSKLTRICGPEKGMKYPESENIWEKRITKMITSIKLYWDVPPIIVWRRDNMLSIADGAHRYEAQKRLNCKSCWVFIWTDK